ncbi:MULTISPECIES: trimeric intracellular cation channel family protein [Nocardiopsidaceae]|uniref:Trimeric intracellular cation channel family protein n=1 Tax=Streptomonospora nanhaiensis TaxID=1323731 RepID=A0ABY6YEX5_9ACTN|nr:trimeric intracellular cation channel family protein [Streptomonospora nanhaiensis]WAE70782.1 trimeric intracellular cation channel family protein [Streptomonospora nanhaiensis]
MSTQNLLLVLDLVGILAFAVDGALTAIRTARVDIVGVLSLGLVTAIGGGVIRDVLLGVTPATFQDWRYITTALVGGTLAFFLSRQLTHLSRPILLFDAAGLSLFAVIGATKAQEMGFGPLQAVLLGAITGVGGGTVRDVLLNRVPTVLSANSHLYAIPAMLGAAFVVLANVAGFGTGLVAVVGALVCFTVRILALRYRWNAPLPPGAPPL